MGNIVAIVGRPNVGKSTLFNRLTGTRQAIVDEMSGVTRDRLYGKAHWNGIDFSVIDTGGYAINSEDVFEEAIRDQVLIAIEEADILLFVVDVTTGITDYDEMVAEVIRRSGKKALVVVNKVDTHDREAESAYFYSLGLSELYSISSINGAGTGDLLDALVRELPDKQVNRPEEEDLNLPRFAIVGRPNAGKSSLINALTGEDRNIVTPISGTTRDSLYTRFNKFGHDFFLVDTAGIRKKAKVHENLEFYSVMRAVRAIENSDVCILMIDATRGFEGQDQKIFSLIERNRKGIVVVVNKWDLIEKDTHSTKLFEAEIREKTAPYVDYPIIFTSAITKQRLFKTLEEAARVYENRTRKISTSQINEFLLPLIANTPLQQPKESTSKSNSSPNCPPYRPPLPFSATYRNMLRSPTSVSLKIKFAANGTSRVFRSIFSCVKNKDSKKILIFTHSK